MAAPIIELRAVGSTSVRASVTGHSGSPWACNTRLVAWQVRRAFVIERARIDERGMDVG